MLGCVENLQSTNRLCKTSSYETIKMLYFKSHQFVKPYESFDKMYRLHILHGVSGILVCEWKKEKKNTFNLITRR